MHPERPMLPRAGSWDWRKPPRTVAAVAAAAAIAVLAGCAGPAPTPPDDLGSALGLSPDAAPDMAIAGEADGLTPIPAEVDPEWWRVFGDGQLDALVAAAFAGNRDLAKTAVDVRRALLQANKFGADLQPSFQAGLDGSLRRNLKGGGHTAQSYGADTGVNYEIDLWRRLRDLRSAREWEYRATLEDEASLRLALAHSVVDCYYQMAYLRDAIDSTLESMALYERIEAKTREKSRLGKVAPIEPVQAHQSYLSEKTRLIDFQARSKTVEQTLRDLLNLRPADLLDCQPPTLADFTPPSPSLDVPVSVLACRPDLRALEHRLRRAFTDYGATRKSLYPTITLGGALGSSSDRADRIFEMPYTGGNLSISFPFLRWSRIRWDIRLSEAEYERARLDFEQGVVAALNEVDASVFAVGKSLEALAASEEKYANDLQVGEHYQNRYDQGANELSDWLGALNAIGNSRLAIASGRYQAVLDQCRLHKALGGRMIGFAEIEPAGERSSPE